MLVMTSHVAFYSHGGTTYFTDFKRLLVSSSMILEFMRVSSDCEGQGISSITSLPAGSRRERIVIILTRMAALDLSISLAFERRATRSDLEGQVFERAEVLVVLVTAACMANPG